MLWVILSLVAAVGAATQYMFIKKFLKNIDLVVLASGTFLSTSLFAYAWAFIQGLPTLGPNFFPALAVSAVGGTIAAHLYYKALKSSDLSLTIPMLAFAPLFLILTSYLILNEFPSRYGLLGILLIVLGSYFLNLAKVKKGLLEPFRQLFRNKGTRYMLVVAFIYSIIANTDKIITLNSSPAFATASATLVVGTAFLILAFLQKRNIVENYSKHFRKFLLVGAIIAAEVISQQTAWTMQIVPYVISIKRTSAIIGILYGYYIFREKHTRERLLGAAVMVAGAAMIILS